MSGLMPNYILREIDNDGKLLAGGKIYFYESGSLTPKTVYTDFTLSTALPNPVILDASGSEDIFLGDGAYRILVTDANDVQIKPYIDGISSGTAGALSPSTNATVAILKIYEDVRTLTTASDTVYVTGAYTEGDGGAGWFQLQPGSTLLDDDGIVLTAASGSIVYKRVFSGAINPEWYSVKYGVSTDNTTNLGHALAGSIQFNIPVRVTNTVYLTQNVTVPTGSQLECTIDAYFNSGSTVTMTFADGAKFESVGVAFGSTVNAVFGKYVCDTIKLSWFGGAIDQDRWTKLAAVTTYNYNALVDVTTTCSDDVTVPANLALDFTGGAILSINDVVNLSIGNLKYTGMKQIISYDAFASVGTVYIGAPVVFPEWFGAVGADALNGNDTIALKAAFQNKIVYLTGNYALKLPIALTNDLELRGPIFDATVIPSAVTIANYKGVIGFGDTGSLTTTKNLIINGCLLYNAGHVVSCVNTKIFNSCVVGGTIACSGTFMADRFRLIQGTGQGTPCPIAGGVISNSVLNCGGAFPFTKIDSIVDCQINDYGGQTSTSNYVTTSIINTNFDASMQDYTFTSRTINLGTKVTIDGVNFATTSCYDYWHFTTVLPVSVINIKNSTFSASIIKLNSTSVLNIDKVLGDVVNSAELVPGAQSSINVSNNIGGQVNIGQMPEVTTQLVRSIAGYVESDASYATPYGGTAEVYNATSASFLPTAGWTNTVGTAPTTDGTQFTVVDNNSFTWKRNDRSDSAVNYRLSGWSSIGGILKVTITSPSSGAHLLASLQVLLDTTNGVGASNVLNKQLYIPRSSSSEPVILWLPYIGGYWLPASNMGDCMYYQNILQLVGNNMAGYKIKVEYVHRLPVDKGSIAQWSKTAYRLPSTNPSDRVVDLVGVQNNMIVLEGTIPYAKWPAQSTPFYLPKRDSSSGWNILSTYEIGITNNPPYYNAGFGIVNTMWTDRANSSQTSNNCFLCKYDVSTATTYV